LGEVVGIATTTSESARDVCAVGGRAARAGHATLEFALNAFSQIAQLIFREAERIGFVAENIFRGALDALLQLLNGGFTRS
jgi:hypothetical protein